MSTMVGLPDRIYAKFIKFASTNDNINIPILHSYVSIWGNKWDSVELCLNLLSPLTKGNSDFSLSHRYFNITLIY